MRSFAAMMNGSPMGSALLFADRTSSQHWLACGSVVNQADYPNLFAQIGPLADLPAATFAIHDGTSATVAGIASNGTTHIAVSGDTANYVASIAGAAWADQANPLGAACTGADYAKGKFWIFGGSGVIYWSLTGTAGSWTQTAVPASAVINQIIEGSAGRLLAISNSATYWTDDDGASWTLGSSSVLSYCVARNPETGTLIAGLASGAIDRSTDNGASWVNKLSANTKLIGAVNNIACLDGVWFATNNVASTTQAMARSLDDGVTWENITIPLASGLTVMAAGMGNVWIGDAANVSLQVSNDFGLTWEVGANAGYAGDYGVLTLAPNGKLFAGIGTSVQGAQVTSYDPVTQFAIPVIAAAPAGSHYCLKGK